MRQNMDCMKYLSVFCLLCTSVLAYSQSYLTLHIDYDEVQTIRGELYQYSEHYLGTTDVITKSETTFILRDLHEAQAPKERESHVQKKQDKGFVNPSSPLLAPLNEEALLAANTAKKAESVAKQIYRIREARLALVSGEADHLPSDGRAMKQSLDELERMERQLTALFIGQTIVTHHTQTVTFMYDTTLNAQEEVLCRFSRFTGPVAADDLSGAPIQIRVEYEKENIPVTDKKAMKETPYRTRIRQKKVTVTYEGKNLLNRVL